MKKTLIALMALAGVASAAEWIYETPTIASGTHTLSWNNNKYNLNADLYNYLYGVFVEGGTITFNLNIDYTGETHTGTQGLLHVGGKDTGLYIAADTTDNIYVSLKNEVADTYKYDTTLVSGTANAVTITLVGDATNKSASVSVAVAGVTVDKTGVLSWDAMDWNTAVDDYGRQCDKYSVNCLAPGWKDNSTATVTTLTSGSVTFVQGTGKAILVPEPATATLSLLALAGLCARRRRD